MAFTAQYHGRCAAECGVPIVPGDACTHLREPGAGDDGSHDVAHLECTLDPDPAPVRSSAPARFCDKCFLQLPTSGSCDCDQ